MISPILPAVDHIVLHVNDLDVAAVQLADFGLTVVKRDDAEEKPGSTFRFISFADGSYILLNALSPEARTKHRLGPILAEREGFGDWSITVADLDAAKARGSDAGLLFGPESEVRNVLLNGVPWALRLLVSGRGNAGSDPALPFLVQDLHGRAARIPSPSNHACGATGIIGLTIAATSPQGSAAALSLLLDLPRPKPQKLTVVNVQIEVIPTDSAGRGTARLGGPVVLTLSGTSAPIMLGDWPPACFPPAPELRSRRY